LKNRAELATPPKAFNDPPLACRQQREKTIKARKTLGLIAKPAGDSFCVELSLHNQMRLAIV